MSNYNKTVCDHDNPKVDSEQLEILLRCSARKDISEWNKYRRDNGDKEIWLQGVQLSEMHLDRANLSGARLEGARLDKANLKGANLLKAQLEGADLSGANLEGAYLSEARLEGAILIRTHLEGSDVTGAYLEGAQLLEARLESAILWGAHLKGAYLSGVHLESASLIGADLKGAKLLRAHLDNADLTRADLRGAALLEARLDNANLFESHLEGTQLLEANLTHANFSGAHLEGAQLIGTNLGGANLTEAYLDGANFSGAHLEGTDFKAAILDKTIFKNCHIDKNTDFSGTNIDNSVIDPGLHTALKCNIRRKTWSKWYEDKPWYKTSFMKFFWWLSDYGSGLTNLFLFALGSLITLSVLYGVVNIYSDVITSISPPPDYFTIEGLAWALQIFCFSVSTMVTFGFASINIEIIGASPGWSVFATLAVTLNLAIGYFLFAVIVTRIVIMFQSLASEQEYTKN